MSKVPTLYAGDTRPIAVTVKDGDGAVKDLTGKTVHWNLHPLGKDEITLSKSSADSGIEIPDPVLGRFLVRFKTGETTGLEGEMEHGAWLTDGSGDSAQIDTVLLAPIKFIKTRGR